MARTYRGAERVALMTKGTEAYRREMRRIANERVAQITRACSDELDAMIAAALYGED